MIGDQPRVLIVEDDRPAAAELEERLRQFGIEVVGIADSAEEAIEATARTHPDLVLIDVRIEGARDGIWAATEINKEHDVPIVFFTSHADDEALQRALQTSPAGYLYEPLEDRALLATLTSALHRHAVHIVDTVRREEERRYRAVLDHMPNALIVVRRDGTIVDANPSAEQIFGYDRRWLIGASLDWLIPFDRREHHRDLAEKYWLSGGAERAMAPRRQVEALRVDGTTFTVKVSLFTFEFGGQSLAGAVIQDITERLQLEQEYAQAQRLEAVGLLANTIAHDFNNILGAMRMQAAVLSLEVGPSAREGLEEMVALVNRGAALTRQLLSYSSHHGHGTEVVNVRDALAGAEDLYGRLVGSNISLEVLFDQECGAIELAPGQLSQLMMNLVLNARDAMPWGGALAIRAGNVIIDPGESARLGVRAGSYVSIEVIDSGEGMSPETTARVFDPFFTTKPPGKGTGLGLTSIYRFVRAAGGAVSIDSELGAGTAVTVLLPTASEAPPRDEHQIPAAGDEAETAPPALTVLVVDDNARLRASVGQILRENGYHVITARGPGEAMAVFESGAEIDVLLTDLGMPLMSGVELVDRMRRHVPRLGAIIMTGFGEQSPDLDEVPHLLKPFEPSELLGLLRRFS